MCRCARFGSAGVILAAAIGCAAPVRAQEIPTLGGGDIRRWGPRLDTVAVTFSSRDIWRGFDLGAPAVGVVAGIGVWGRSVTGAGRWNVAAGLGGTAVPDARPGAPARGRVAGSLAITRRLGGPDAFAALVADAYHLPGLDAEPTGAEVGLRVAEIPVPWLDEVRPLLDAAVLRHLGRFDGSHAELGVKQAFGIQNIQAALDGRLLWNDYAGRAFRYRAAQLGLSAHRDFILTLRWSVRVAARGALMERGDLPTVGWGSLRVVIRH